MSTGTSDAFTFKFATLISSKLAGDDLDRLWEIGCKGKNISFDAKS